jgi:hypothetical protein
MGLSASSSAVCVRRTRLSVAMARICSGAATGSSAGLGGVLPLPGRAMGSDPQGLTPTRRAPPRSGARGSPAPARR